MHLRRLSAACAAAAGLALLATPALASAASADGPPPLTVYVGGDSSGTQYPVSGINKDDVTLTANGIPLTCTNSMLTGSVTTGSSNDGMHVGEIDGATFTSCTLATFAATVTANNFPWDLNLTNVTPPDDASGHSHSADGNVSNVGAHVDVNVLGVHCTFDVSGSVNGSIVVKTDGSDTQDLTTTSDATLTLSNVSAGCVGLVTNGSSASFAGDYNLTVTDPITGAIIPNPPISFTNP